MPTNQIKKAVRLFNLTAFTCKMGRTLSFHRIKNPDCRKLKTVSHNNAHGERAVSLPGCNF
jgi:hypothetical protein